jgi:hypothetical protein
MKAKPLIVAGGVRTPCAPADATHLAIRMPGPIGKLTLPVILKGSRAGTPNWTWNGDVDRPTLRPSVLSDDGQGIVCHSWINDGKAQFLGETTHELRGQTVEMLDVDED